MKFTKDDAYKELVVKIPNGGQTLNLSERSINEQLDTLLPLLADDETELSEFVEKVLPIFKTADGNVRNDVSVKIKAYKEEHPKEETKTTETRGEEDTKEKTVTDPTAELLRRIEELEKRNADNEKRTKLHTRRSSIVTKMNEKGCRDNEWIDNLLDEVNLESEEFDVDARVDKYIKMYNKTKAKTDSNVTPLPPDTKSGNAYLDKIIKAAAEKNRGSVLGQ